MNLEHKFCALGSEVTVTDGTTISGYASLFGKSDQGGDIVEKGAYGASLARGRGVKMLWQHDPAQPIVCGTKCERMKQGFGSRAGC